MNGIKLLSAIANITEDRSAVILKKLNLSSSDELKLIEAINDIDNMIPVPADYLLEKIVEKLQLNSL